MYCKIVISSKVLAIQLNQIDFKGGEYVEFADLADGILTITTSQRAIRIHVDASPLGPVLFKQGEARWDWACEMLKSISEQPIVLELMDNCVKITVAY